MVEITGAGPDGETPDPHPAIRPTTTRPGFGQPPGTGTRLPGVSAPPPAAEK